MKFDYMIMNPPFGKSSSLAAQLIPKLSKCSKNTTYLAPINTLKYKEVLEHSKNITEHENYFDAIIGTLVIAQYDRNFENVERYEDVVLKNKNLKLKTLKDVIFKYNENKEPTFYCIDGNCLCNKFNKKLKDASKQILPKAFKNIENENCRNLMKKSYMFYITVRNSVDGVHFNEALDTLYNYKNIWDENNEFARHGDMICFPTVEQKNNFRDWWYSCTKKYVSKIECNGRGLMNQIDKLLFLCVSAGAGILSYNEYIPRVDWSRPWTDEEILKEIGLPEDFLEKED